MTDRDAVQRAITNRRERLRERLRAAWIEGAEVEWSCQREAVA